MSKGIAGGLSSLGYFFGGLFMLQISLDTRPARKALYISIPITASFFIYTLMRMVAGPKDQHLL